MLYLTCVNSNAKVTSVNSHLASLNLPGAIEAIEQPMGLPQSVIQRCEEFRGEGGVRAFQDSTETVSSLAAKVASIIEEVSSVSFCKLNRSIMWLIMFFVKGIEDA